jgi:hypothetical protein
VTEVREQFRPLGFFTTGENVNAAEIELGEDNVSHFGMLIALI